MTTNDHHDHSILLVDDEADIRDVLSISLTDMGLNVTCAENGRQALEAFKKKQYPVILTDIKMPEMDGIQLLKEIKRLSPFTEIIMITGHGDMDLAIESFRNQAVEFITKPVDVHVLKIAIDRAREKIEINKKLFDYTTRLEQLILDKTLQLETAQSVPVPKKGFSALMDHLPLVIFLINPEMKITALNQRFREMFGDHIGKPCYTICKTRKAPCPECPALETFSTQASKQAEVTFKNLKGEDITFLVWSSPIQSADSQVSEVMLLATELSDVVNIRDHLTSLGLMIGSVSHGIKGLLTGLDGGVYVLDSALEKQDQDQAKEGLEMVRQMTGKMKKIILDILFYAKERELKTELIQARQFLKDLIRITRPKADPHGIVLKAEFPAEEIDFFADYGVLHSAFVNVIDNAVDACLADTQKPRHEIGLSFSRNQDSIEFRITDTGIGMDPEEIKKIFTLFHSGKGKQGTGLGLFIAEKSIHQHRGTIKAQSKKGKGSQFIITLPLK